MLRNGKFLTVDITDDVNPRVVTILRSRRKVWSPLQKKKLRVSLGLPRDEFALMMLDFAEGKRGALSKCGRSAID